MQLFGNLLFTLVELTKEKKSSLWSQWDLHPLQQLFPSPKLMTRATLLKNFHIPIPFGSLVQHVK